MKHSKSRDVEPRPQPHKFFFQGEELLPGQTWQLDYDGVWRKAGPRVLTGNNFGTRLVEERKP